jgi:hypothetical protein
MLAELAYGTAFAVHGMSNRTGYEVMLGVVESSSDSLQLECIEYIFEEDNGAVDAKPTSGISHQPKMELRG